MLVYTLTEQLEIYTEGKQKGSSSRREQKDLGKGKEKS